MECVLQWLDELDDLVFVFFQQNETLRRGALGTGLAAALTLAACVLVAAFEWIPPLAAIAAASVAVWSWTAAAAVLSRARRRLPDRA
jgi:uncharacterized membrane protein YdjX (TVP38/TMEM64 family)